jgi:predicted HicB family RNase H-like nuclease
MRRKRFDPPIAVRVTPDVTRRLEAKANADGDLVCGVIRRLLKQALDHEDAIREAGEADR